jgi:hypothetical protein
MPQWEYCSIQYEEDSSQQTSDQGTDYHSSEGGRERSFLERLVGVPPVSEKVAKSAPYFVSYFFHRMHGLDRHTLYEGDDLSKVDEETSKYIAILGMYGWEAIHVVRLENGCEHWYFKRKIDPSNQYITF